MLCKSPNDNYTLRVDWTNELGADTISSSAWVLEAGITNDGDTNTTVFADIDLSGGAAGVTYKMVNTINTAGGDVFEREMHIKVQNIITS